MWLQVAHLDPAEKLRSFTLGYRQVVHDQRVLCVVIASCYAIAAENTGALQDLWAVRVFLVVGVFLRGEVLVLSGLERNRDG